MPDKETIRRARRDAAQGKSPSTQAGEFVREEIHHVREGKHGARSPKQAIAIGLSKARRAGVKLPAPAAGKTSTGTRRRAKRDLSRSRSSSRPSARRARAAKSALRRERRSSASRPALARQARAAARRRKSR
jgi:poly-gamma-glutamate capsule biosynthesis protein CapA/YwtB (metallophosphatase superfamily)